MALNLLKEVSFSLVLLLRSDDILEIVFLFAKNVRTIGNANEPFSQEPSALSSFQIK
jgi:hypothetical protein